jgi:peptidyl-prolyl cis-trans isomerase C
LPKASSWLRQGLREPLFHFLFAGAALFAIGGWFGRTDGDDRSITINAAEVGRLAEQWQQTWRRPPSAAELDGLIRDYIKEEVYFREAMRLGLDQDDPVIRRRMRSKMEYLAASQVENATPTDTELAAFYSRNKARYVADAVYDFDQRYFGDDTAAARAAIAPLNAVKGVASASLDLPNSMSNADETAVRRQFGDDFTNDLRTLPINKWAGPVQSGYGWHAVRVRRVNAPLTSALRDVLPKVTNDWRAETRAQRDAAAYQTLLDGYTIKIEKP